MTLVLQADVYTTRSIEGAAALCRQGGTQVIDQYVGENLWKETDLSLPGECAEAAGKATLLVRRQEVG